MLPVYAPQTFSYLIFTQFLHPNYSRSNKYNLSILYFLLYGLLTIYAGRVESILLCSNSRHLVGRKGDFVNIFTKFLKIRTPDKLVTDDTLVFACPQFPRCGTHAGPLVEIDRRVCSQHHGQLTVRLFYSEYRYGRQKHLNKTSSNSF